MRGGDVLAMFGIMLMAVYLNLNWLLAILAAVLFLAMLGGAPARKQAAAPAGAGEEVLVPVTEDVGPVPWLYPPKFDLKIRPDWRSDSMNEHFAATMANIVRAGAIGVRKAMGEREKK